MPQLINAFNSGELTPRVAGRTPQDWPKYATGCKELENFIVQTQGGVTRRPGTTHLAAAKDADKAVRLIPFAFSESIAYCLEFGDLYIRFYRDGVQLGAPYEVVTPYLESELRDLRFEQSADVLYITAPDHPPAILSRFADTTWTLVDVPITAGPFLTQNDTDSLLACNFDAWRTGRTYAIDDTVRVADAEKDISSAATNLIDETLSGIPVIGHGYSTGGQVRIFGTVNYDGVYTVEASTTANLVVIKKAYVAETFSTGTEKIEKRAFYKALTAHTSDSAGPPFETPPGNTTDWKETLHFSGNSLRVQNNRNLFNEGHVGAFFKLSYVRTSFVIRDTFSAVKASAPIPIFGDWSFVTHGTWDGTVEIQRSKDDGTTWTSFRSFASQSDRNVLTDGIELEPNVLYRVLMTKRNSGTLNWDFTPDETNVSGIIQITSVASSSFASANIIETLPSLDSTADWSEGAFSDYRGHPQTVSFFEERLVFGGNAYRPLTLWLSKTGDFHNMRAGTLDDDAIVYNLSSDKINPIKWMEFQESLIVGTAGSEWQISSGSSGEPITPTSVVAKRHTTNGSANLKGTLIDDSILFVEKTGRKLRELSFDFDRQGFIAPDVSIQSEHITYPGIVETSFSEHQHRILWAVRSDGVLLSFTYDRIQEVLAWARHTTDGKFESVAVVPGATEDLVYVSVMRTISGGAQRHIELLSPIEFIDRRDALFMDDSLEYPGVEDTVITTVTQGATTTVWSVAHGLIAGDDVRITGVTGMTEINDTFVVKTAATDSFTLQENGGTDALDSSGFGAFSPTATPITNITKERQAVVTAPGHGLAFEQRVSIMGVGGMTEVNNIEFYVFPIDADSYKIRDYVTDNFVDSTFYNKYTSGGTGTNVAEAQKVENTFTGLSHLEGKFVQVIGEGALSTPKKVESGQIVTDDYFSKAKVGLGYSSILQPMPPENTFGSSQGVKSRIIRVGVMIEKSLSFAIGPDRDDLQLQDFQSSSMFTDFGPQIFTGYRELNFPNGYHDLNPIIISQDKPLPLTVLSLIIDVESSRL